MKCVCVCVCDKVMMAIMELEIFFLAFVSFENRDDLDLSL